MYQHNFTNPKQAGSRKTKAALILTFIVMLIEIFCGLHFRSMALLADGYHMSSHALALALALLAYWASKHFASDHRFSMGAWKIEILAAYTSALFLLIIALFMIYESILRFKDPEQILYIEAICVAFLGLLVNVFSAFLLHDDSHSQFTHSHSHGSEHGEYVYEHTGRGYEGEGTYVDCGKTHSDENGHSHACHENGHSHACHEQGEQGHEHKEQGQSSHSQENQGQDLNLKAAYVHVLADAATSILAIIALFGGLFFGWNFLDPLMGVIGALVISLWALGLIKDAGKILLDAQMDIPLSSKIKAELKLHNIELLDFHLGQVAQDKYHCTLAVRNATDAASVKALLRKFSSLDHVIVEIA